jgi:alpha-glucosidase
MEHPWFEESRASRDNPKADWYVWADAKADGSPPTNWQSWMGCPTWTWEPRRQQYYLHNFLPQMPDLNFHNREVQDAILDVGRFWLARGVDGFRLDTANYYCHDPLLRDNPPQPPERRGDIPAAMQQHLFNVCQPQTLPFLERVRALTDEFPDRFTVAEIGSANNLDRMIEYTSGTRRLHTAYSFVLLGGQPAADGLMQIISPWQQGPGAQAWPSWALSNHDVPRVATRWAQSDHARTQQLLALLSVLRGTLFIYQGEELGLPQSDIAFEQLQDPFGKAHWPRDKGRDGCRTPMPWRAGARNAGFSTSDQPWLPADPAHGARAVDVQEADPSSCLQLTRRLLALRRRHAALRVGSFEPVCVDEQVLVVLRRDGADGVLAAFNLSDTARTVDLAPDLAGLVPDPLTLGDVQRQGKRLSLGPWAALIGAVEAVQP